MIRAVYARGILEALARTAGAGPIFDAVWRCIEEISVVEQQEETAGWRTRSIDDLEISVRLKYAFEDRNITTVGQLEGMTADELTKMKPTVMRDRSGWSPPVHFGKKCLKETREILASFGMKLKGDP